MSPEIDLTANRDFGNRGRITFNFLLDEYDEDIPPIKKRLEILFGRNRHRSEKDLFFNESIFDGYCVRCGKKLKPWSTRSRELCDDCCSSFDIKIPWRSWIIIRLGDRWQGDLFDLR